MRTANDATATTRTIIGRFNDAFTAHRPDDLDDLIGEG
jgi:hypothetical protein